MRSRKHAQYLPRYGWSCEVITAYKGNDVASLFPESVRIHPVWTFDFDRILSAAVKLLSRVRYIIQKKGSAWGFKKNGRKQDTVISEGGFGIASKIQSWLLVPDSQFLWILFALPRALWYARSCQVLYSSALPVSSHVLGLIIHKVTRKPWVADYRDPWTLDNEWLPPTRFHRWLGERLDKACVKNAHYVVNVTDVKTQNFKKKYFEYADKCITIHNGYDEDDVAGFRGIKLTEEYMLFTSLGSMYAGRDPAFFLAALEELLEEGIISRSSVKVLFIGGQNTQLELIIAKHSLEGIVKTLPQMPQSEAFEYLAMSHVALLVGSDMEKTAMTTKVYEYAGMGKLIFALVPDGPVKKFVENCSGVVADPKDKAQISAALKTLFNRYQEGNITNSSVSPSTSQYERSKLALQLAELFNKACQ